MFLCSQAVSVLMQPETTYIALWTLANSSWVTGCWPGLGRFPSQCLSMRTRPGWIVCFTALPAQARAAADAAEHSSSAPLRQTSASLWGGVQQGPRSPKCFIPLPGTRARKEFLGVTLLLSSSIKGREGTGEEPRWQSPSSCLRLQGRCAGARQNSLGSQTVQAVPVHQRQPFSKVC